MRVYRVTVSAVGDRREDERMNGGGHRVWEVFHFDVGATELQQAARFIIRGLRFGVERREFFGSGGRYLTSDMECGLGEVVWVSLADNVCIEGIRIRPVRYDAECGEITGLDEASRLVVEVTRHGYDMVRARRAGV